jgi:hypothetical protein
MAVREGEAGNKEKCDDIYSWTFWGSACIVGAALRLRDEIENPEALRRTHPIAQLLKLVARLLQQVPGLIILALHALDIAETLEALRRTHPIAQLLKLIARLLQRVAGLVILALQRV